MKRRFLAVLLGTTLMASNVYADDIFKAMGNAYDTNPSLKAQRAYLRSVDENVALANSGYRPNISLGASYVDADNSDNSVTYPQHDRQSTNLAAKISQPIFTGFQTVNSVKAAESYIRSEQYNLGNFEQKTLLSAATAYLDVLRDTVIVELQQNNENLLKQKLDETKERFSVGDLTKTDLAQSEARYAQARADTIASMGTVEASKARYKMIVGTLPTELEEPYEIVSLLPSTADEAIEYTMANNFSIKQAEHAMDSRDYEAKSATGVLLPSVTLDGAATKSKIDTRPYPKKGEINSLEWSVNANIPLYQGGSERAKIRQAKYNKWQAREMISVAESQAIADVSSYWEYLIANQAKVKAIAEQIKANEVALEGVTREESVGNRTVLEVLDAYQALLSSKVEEEKARRDYYLSSMNLLLTMGKLTAKDLELEVDLYNAKQQSKDTAGKWLSTSIDK